MAALRMSNSNNSTLHYKGDDKSTYHLTCWLSGGRDCCSSAFPNRSSSSMALGGAVAPSTGGARGF